ADITVANERMWGGEPVADITVRSSELSGVRIGGEVIPRLIDELPVLAVAAAFAKGTTVICDAQELKVKETNRIAAVTAELLRAGVDIEETEDGMIIRGGKPVHGAAFETYHDHRMAMSMAVLALAAEGESEILNPDVVDISFPNFYELLNEVRR
ncbi:MAG: 3-phosphoshikimate 1-carboxyvinyltransferase, partial [Clostridia bacterium]|nr:3-phosphoshikimate 1-carboxyvinyltransferase [Clostridia bacterium]